MSITPNKLDEKEKERLLQQYMGIFRHEIRQFGELLAKRPNKPRTNHAK